jgi:predicted DNA-binding transcriptional regulator YafY
MRASRLVSILMLLQTRGRMTAGEIAGVLEVSVRTVYRDMESLSEAGVPLYGEAGTGGGYRLLDGYRTRLTGLTADEAQSLFLTSLPGTATELGLGAVVAAAQLKLMAALPEELRDRAGRVRERFHLDAPSWYHDPDRTPYLAAVADAVWNELRAEIRYLRWSAPHEVGRTVEPYGVVLKGGRWYLVAGGDSGVRTYRVARIVGLRVGSDHFDRPPGFDLTGYWQAHLADFDARRHRDQATVRLSPYAFERLPYLMEPTVAQAAARTATPGDDGWTEVVVPIESVEQALPEFLKLGDEAEILAPAGLRAQITRIVAGLARIYGAPAEK